MSQCSRCGVDPGFEAVVCPSCGAKAAGSFLPETGGGYRGGGRVFSEPTRHAETVYSESPTYAPLGNAKNAVGCFLVVEGADAGTRFLIEKAGIVGRGNDALFTLHDPRVSARHAHVDVEGGRVVYLDLETTNGSYLTVGGTQRRLRGPRVVTDGDEITLGGTVLRYIELHDGGRS